MTSVREFAFQSGLGQWNTVETYQVSTLEEALTKINESRDRRRRRLSAEAAQRTAHDRRAWIDIPIGHDERKRS